MASLHKGKKLSRKAFVQCWLILVNNHRSQFCNADNMFYAIIEAK